MRATMRSEASVKEVRHHSGLSWRQARGGTNARVSFSSLRERRYISREPCFKVKRHESSTNLQPGCLQRSAVSLEERRAPSRSY